MLTDTTYRITGDIIIKNKIAATTTTNKQKGKKIELSYGSTRTTNFDNVAIIQTRKPLTPKSPYFLLEVQKCGKMKKKSSFSF